MGNHFCEQCGEALSSTANYCSQCGKRVGSSRNGSREMGVITKCAMCGGHGASHLGEICPACNGKGQVRV